MADVNRRTRRPLAPLFAAGLSLLALAGCGLFKVASPELGGAGKTLIANYSTPDSCLAYMRLGIEDKAKGQQLYIGALADTADNVAGFHAWFDESVLRQFTIQPTEWTLDNERDFFNYFIQRTNYPYSMVWARDTLKYDDNDPTASQATLYRHYLVYSIEPVSGGGTQAVLIAIGYADLYFVKISAGRWALRRWDDRVDPLIGAQPSNDLQRTFGYHRLRSSGG